MSTDKGVAIYHCTECGRTTIHPNALKCWDSFHCACDTKMNSMKQIAFTPHKVVWNILQKEKP